MIDVAPYRVEPLMVPLVGPVQWLAGVIIGSLVVLAVTAWLLSRDTSPSGKRRRPDDAGTIRVSRNMSILGLAFLALGLLRWLFGNGVLG